MRRKFHILVNEVNEAFDGFIENFHLVLTLYDFIIELDSNLSNLFSISRYKLEKYLHKRFKEIS